MILKKSYIDYVIECYKNFPELLEIFPEKKLNKLLNKNITTIKRCKVNNKYAGLYYCDSRKIRIASKNKIDIDKIKNDSKLTIVAVHEATHGLFKHNLFIGKTGCSKNCLRSLLRKPKIRKQIKYKKSTNLKSLISNMGNDLELGNAMNEGFTEWITKKCVGTYGAYNFNRQIIELIESIKGTKETLKIGKGKFKEIRELLNMDKSCFVDFMSKFDIYQELSYKDSEEVTTSEEKMKIKLAKSVCQSLVKHLIIPEQISNIDFGKEGYEKFIKIKNKLEDIYYDNLYNETESFFDVFPEIQKLQELYNDNSDKWISDYNEKFDELSDLEIISLSATLFDNEKILNTKESKIFIKKMQKKDQVNIDNIKEKVSQECMTEKTIDLKKVQEIILSSEKLDCMTINCKLQIIQLLIGRELQGDDKINAVLEFNELTNYRYDMYSPYNLIDENGKIIGETHFFDKNRFICKQEKESQLENITEEELDEIESNIKAEYGEIEEMDYVTINEDLDDEDLIEENSYDLFNIVGKSIYKYKLKLKEIVNSPIKYMRRKLKRGVDSDEFEQR